jgi:cystathionine gamma-synthase
LNPLGRHYEELRAHIATSYEDTYYDEDAIYMERNSRNFKRRIQIIDSNTEAVCDFLRSRSLATHAPSAVIREVFYPKYISRENYEHCRIKALDEAGRKEGGFGGLFSLTFTSLAASQAFFDTLSCYKGPSLGTNFTLACPYTVIAHFAEMDWAARFGLEEGLVRISVGMEERTSLLLSFRVALDAAEATAKVV